jgi:hypothetical protein
MVGAKSAGKEKITENSLSQYESSPPSCIYHLFYQIRNKTWQLNRILLL